MFPRTGFSVLSLTLLGLSLASSLHADTIPSSKRASELVRQLGDEEYVERIRAMELLKKMGLEAKAALEEGIRDADPEIEWRCRDLLPAVMEMDLRKRVAAFLADKEGKQEHDLPLWKLYRKEIADEAQARLLYGEMLEGDTLQFLVECAENPKDQSTLLDHYCQNLQLQMSNQPGPHRPGTPITRAQVAAGLLIGAEANGQLQTAFSLNNMLYQPQVRAALNDGPQAPAFKKLLLRWMNGQTNEQVLLNLSHTSQNLQLKETNEFLCNVIRDKKVKGVYLAQMAVNLARQGKKEHLKVLATMLDDKTVLGRLQFNGVAGTTEIRDVALAMMVQLSGGSHKDYGFSFLTMNPALVWVPNYAGFATNELREAAHKKWKERPEVRDMK